MMKKLTQLIIALSWTVQPLSNANAELVPKDGMAKCEMHAVGIYSAKDHSTDDRVFVEVTASGKPIVLVLSSYYETQWNLKVADGVDIRQIIVPGYFQQEVVGVPKGVPVETITWFTKDNERRREDFFFAYSLQTTRGRQFRSRLQEMTGLPLTTFQGSYEAREVVVDGSPGRLPGNVDSTGTAEGNETVVDESTEKPLKLIEDATINLANEISKGQQSESNGKLLRQLVKQSFDIQTEDYQKRLEAAKRNIALLEKQLANRQKNEGTIIGNRVAELTNKDQAEKQADDPKLAAERLASDGWTLWKGLDYETAITKFEKAIELDPSSGAARNGLGWSQVHLQRPRAAAKTFEKILADEPQHGAARNGLGMSLMAVGEYENANKEFLTAVNGAIETAGEERAAKVGMAAWFGLVQSFQKLEQYDEAREWADRYLAHNDDPNMKKQRDSIPEKGSP